jgi:hypothetical protein
MPGVKVKKRKYGHGSERNENLSMKANELKHGYKNRRVAYPGIKQKISKPWYARI